MVSNWTMRVLSCHKYQGIYVCVFFPLSLTHSLSPFKWRIKRQSYHDYTDYYTYQRNGIMKYFSNDYAASLVYVHYSCEFACSATHTHTPHCVFLLFCSFCGWTLSRRCCVCVYANASENKKSHCTIHCVYTYVFVRVRTVVNGMLRVSCESVCIHFHCVKCQLICASLACTSYAYTRARIVQVC